MRSSTEDHPLRSNAENMKRNPTALSFRTSLIQVSISLSLIFSNARTLSTHAFSPVRALSKTQRHLSLNYPRGSSCSPIDATTALSRRFYSDNGMLDHRPSSFEERMRRLLKNPTTPSSRGRTKDGRTRNVQEILSLQDYKRVVADETNQIVVVRFYASWCKACRAVAPVFYKLAHTYEGVVKFVEVPVTDTTATIHQGLEVPTLPYAHIYHPSVGLVHEGRLTRKDMASFSSVLKSYVDGSCQVTSEDASENPYLPDDETLKLRP